MKKISNLIALLLGFSVIGCTNADNNFETDFFNSTYKIVTEKDIRFQKNWEASREFNNYLLTLDTTQVGCASSLPIWMEKGTVLSVNKDILDNIRYKEATIPNVTVTLIDKTGPHDLVRVGQDFMVKGYQVDIITSGYYTFSIFNAGNRFYDIIKQYGNPFDFEYKAQINFEPNYVFTKEWGKTDFIIGTTPICEASYDNWLEWACHRKVGKPIYISNAGKGSLTDCCMFQYSTHDFAGEKTSTSRQNIIKIKDEFWLIGPSNDAGSGLGIIHKLKIFDNGWVEYLGHFWHNFGHLNSISYENITDTLTFGNGSYNYDLEGVGTIITNFSQTACMKSYDGEIICLSDLDNNVSRQNYSKSEYGFKFNLISYGYYCISNVNYLKFAMVTNDGNSIRLGRLDLSNNILLSNIVWDAPINVRDVNESINSSYHHSVNTVCLFNGKLTWAEGHNSETRIVYLDKDIENNYYLKSTLLLGFENISTLCVYNGELVIGTDCQIAFRNIHSL